MSPFFSRILTLVACVIFANACADDTGLTGAGKSKRGATKTKQVVRRAEGQGQGEGDKSGSGGGSGSGSHGKDKGTAPVNGLRSDKPKVDLKKPFRDPSTGIVHLPLGGDHPLTGTVKSCDSSDEKVAKCAANAVKATGPGTTTVTVVLDDLPKELKVSVYDPSQPPEAVIAAASRLEEVAVSTDTAFAPGTNELVPIVDADAGGGGAEASAGGAENPGPTELSGDPALDVEIQSAEGEVAPLPAFGGFYRKIGHETVCQIKNPFTNDCSCPTGYAASRFHEFYDEHHEYYCSEPGKCSISTFACWKTENVEDNVAGIFRSYHNGACPNPNPFTGDCSCPEGFRSRAISEFADIGERYFCTAQGGPCGIQLQACTKDELGPGNSGGFFRRHNDGTCQFPNNFTGNCTCPPTFREAVLDEFTDAHKRFYCNGAGTVCGMSVKACIK